MVFRSSISNTRKFFQKTIHNFKSFFSNNGTYHILPKTPKHNHHPNLTIITLSSPSSSAINKQSQPKPRDYVTKNRALILQPRRGERDERLFSKPKVELVCQKLKEMEKMMNNDIINDEGHVSDVTEFLHYYSRLSYAAYLDVVEQFFMEVYSNFSDPPPSPAH